MKDHDEFYIGWEDKAAPTFRRTARRAAVALLALVIVTGAALALSQRLIGTAYFEWGNMREFSGVLRAEPYPHLLLRTNGADSPLVAAPLVAPFKFGVRREDVAAFADQFVTLRATRIHRDGQLMLELVPGSLAVAASSRSSRRGEGQGEGLRAESLVSHGRQTLRGEIVDSKCWMGVMNPGVLAPHRACAVRCISGGIPPMLLVRREGAPPLTFLLVSTEGLPLKDEVLNWVAIPVEVTGDVEERDGLSVLRIDPSLIREASSR